MPDVVALLYETGLGVFSMRTILGLGIALLFASSSKAADKYALDGENTKVEFVGAKPDGKHTGGFKKVTGTATIDGEITTLKLEVEIDMDSLYSDDTKLTGHLKSPDFFGVKANPKSTFVSSKVEKSDAGYTITGDLTMNGKKNSVSFPAKIEAKDGALTINSEFKLDRTKFGMTYGKGKIDDEATVTVKVTAKK
jgi:polyisoprenoid-binding protein YceI